MPLILITGPMKSGKSLELIARVAPYEFANKKVLYVQPALNTRDDGIISRVGVRTKAVKVRSLSEVRNGFDVVGIDEINMFAVDDIAVVKQWLQAGKTVIASGLNLDYQAKVPDAVKSLLELAPDEISNKSAVCEVCSSMDGRFSQILHKGKVVRSGLPSIVPEDGAYEYRAVCRLDYFKS